MKHLKTLAALALFSTTLPAFASLDFNGVQPNGVTLNSGWLNGTADTGIKAGTVVSVDLPDAERTDHGFKVCTRGDGSCADSNGPSLHGAAAGIETGAVIAVDLLDQGRTDHGFKSCTRTDGSCSDSNGPSLNGVAQ